ncbi:hypothetical protein ACIQOW_15365 [Kitasatospora sp. NPDC091335]|uniref:hypothetical protein n=1 Tax=Kitasatospora sp. NPDC091335 TaxID=3364085 RepID=UPI0038051C50
MTPGEFIDMIQSQNFGETGSHFPSLKAATERGIWPAQAVAGCGTLPTEVAPDLDGEVAPADLEELTALPEAFHIPVRDLGYRPIWDYRIDQLGIQGSHTGALLIDGTWYCPDLPQPLTTATADLLTKNIDHTTWRARIDARASYRLRPKAAPDHRGAPAHALPRSRHPPHGRLPRQTPQPRP